MATKFTVTFEDVRKCREQVEELERRLSEAKEALRATQKAYDEAVETQVVRWVYRDECGNEDVGMDVVRGTYTEIKDVISKLRKDGCYDITATGM